VTTAAYARYVAQAGFRERLLLELSRKPFEEMRWEELWDAALRIRNAFLRTPLPEELARALRNDLAPAVDGMAVVVRSSAPAEDQAGASFAGLHESFVNVIGIDAVLEHVKLVWASLWSDRALLYRKELALDPDKSTMAVVVQHLIAGDRSGVIFGQDPTDPTRVIVEAVYGLNQGLVDGSVEPDRWFLDRASGAVQAHAPPEARRAAVPEPAGVRIRSGTPEEQRSPPLGTGELRELHELVMRIEGLRGAPQDVEWTYRDGRLYCLQARPITRTGAADPNDQRPWYVSLHRSLEELRVLGKRIEDEFFPGMERDAEELGQVDLGVLDDAELAREIERRRRIVETWRAAYQRDCIPFAHGMRLFGQVYNDVVRPEDPYEFMAILTAGSMVALDRNASLAALAAELRAVETAPDTGAARAAFESSLDEFLRRFGGTVGVGKRREELRSVIRSLVEKLAHRATPERADSAARREELTERFLSRFEGEERRHAEDLLAIGRQSYRLRDEDNLYLGRIEALELAAREERRRRRGTEYDEKNEAAPPPAAPGINPRQLIGQPAGPGVAEGPARVVADTADLKTVSPGDILVVDAISPTMTFVVPLVAAIVERRGGMLIHGAIIAREYGIPCVTGIPDATRVIRSGDPLVVDGYLGIVRVERQ
jgi:pyruvate,water dikinase